MVYVAGIAFTGGGITALLSAMCAFQALVSIDDVVTVHQQTTAVGPRGLLAEYPISLNSGGAVGVLIYDSFQQNQEERNLIFPQNYTTLRSDAEAYDTLKKKGSNEDKNWYANILEYTPHDASFESLLALLRSLGIFPSIIGKNNWWMLALQAVIDKAYALAANGGQSFRPEVGSDRYVTFGLAKSDGCPMPRDTATSTSTTARVGGDNTGEDTRMSSAAMTKTTTVSSSSSSETLLGGNGYLPSNVASKYLCTGWARYTMSATSSSFSAAPEGSTSFACENRTGTLELKAKDEPFSSLEGVAAASSFWNSDIVTGSSLTFAALKGWLKSYDGRSTSTSSSSSSSSSSSEYYAMDGGVVDTTGVVALLRAKANAIVLFYNDNNDLVDQNASLSFLFGVDASTNSMNALEGPRLAHVFASTADVDENNGGDYPSTTHLYDAMMRNLTDGDVLRAHLRNVSVLDNAYFGVRAYTLEHLYVLSNQFSSRFVDSFADTRIRDNLDEKWPNRFPVAMNDFNANMLCVFNQWKVQTYASELAEVLFPPCNPLRGGGGGTKMEERACKVAE